MTGVSLLAATIVPLAFGAAVVLVRSAVDRRRLGIVHPALVWLLLSGVFLGLGSAILAASGEATGPAIYVAGSVLAFGLGVAASDRLAARRGDAEPHPASASGARREPLSLGAYRWAPLVLAAVSIGAIAPTLIRSGVPFFTTDITGARAELTGLPVQLVRIALPGLAGLAMLDALRTTDSTRRLVSLGAIVAIGCFMVALASRYLVAELGAVLLLAWMVAGRRIPARTMAAIGILGIVGFGAIQVLRAYDQAAGNELGFAAGRTLNRIVFIQPRTVAALQRVIPDEEPYFLGLTWVRRLGPFIGREEIPNLGYWIYPEVVEGEQDAAGYAAPGVIGEAWANFGPGGLALFVVLGVLAERIGALVAARRQRGVDVVAGSMAVLFLARTHALGLGGLAILGIVVVAWRLLAGPPAGLGGALRASVTWSPQAMAER